MKTRVKRLNRVTWPWKAGLGMGVVLILFLLGVLAAPYVPVMRDFDQTYYPAIRYALAGQNPYTGEYQVTDQGAPPVFFNPAWYLVILLPFGLLPFELARAEWLIFMVVVTFTCIFLLRADGLKGPWTLLLVALPWSLITLLFGQPTPLVLLGSLLAIHQAAQTSTSLKSSLFILLGLVLMGIKPHLGVFIVLPLGIWLLSRRDRRLPMIVGGGLLFLLLAWLLSPPWPIAEAIKTQEHLAPLWKSTLERELLLWQLPGWIAWVVRLVVIGVMGWWAWRVRDLTPEWWATMLGAVLILTPYTRAYDGMLLLPLLGWLIARHWPLALLFLVVVIAYTSLPLGELGSVVTPLTAWLLFVPWRRLILPQT